MNTKEIMPSWPMPTLRDEPTPFGGWGRSPLGGPYDYDAGNRAMCDCAAARFREGVCDLVNFDCMPVDVPYIKEYMTTHHPDVHYTCGSTERILHKAMHLWSEEYRRLNSAIDAARGKP